MNRYNILFWKALTVNITEATCMHSCHKMPSCQVLDLSSFSINLVILSFLKKTQSTPMSH